MSKKKEKMELQLSKNLPDDPVKSSNRAKQEIQDDYEYSRKMYRDILDKGASALDMMLEVAQDSEHPRAYEVVAKLVKDLGDTTDKLMDLQSKRKEINKEETAKQERADVTNNNVFIGSTSDLQKMLLDAKVKDIIDVDGA